MSGQASHASFGDRVMNLSTTGVKAELDRLSRAFFRAVSFEPGARPPFDTLHELFVPMGLLVKNTGATPEIGKRPDRIAILGSVATAAPASVRDSSAADSAERRRRVRIGSSFRNSGT